MKNFVLHENFNDKCFICNLQLSTLLLEPVNEFPWIIIIPRVESAKNILDLTDNQKLTFWKEIDEVSTAITKIYNPYQINIAMLGNKTPQLHCHVIARFQGDISFPNSPFDVKKTNAECNDLTKVINSVKNILTHI